MKKNTTQHGQVMLLGVAVLLVLTVAALLLFDFHNVLRAKIKVESAQQAAALAGAQWQVIGLNMLGDINLLKACTLMTDESEDIPSYPLQKNRRDFSSTAAWELAKKRQRLDSRLRTLTETQSRISFIVPLLGYMAVQQTAKQNGMSGDNGILKHYLNETLPLMPEEQKSRAYNNFFWYYPYQKLIGEIVDQQCPVRCNARVSEIPDVWSNPAGSASISGSGEGFRLLLSEGELYQAIANRNACYWQLRKMAKKGIYLQPPWWHIDYNPGQFIEESELLPLGIAFGSGTDVQTLLTKEAALPADPNLDENLQPNMWCCYDSKWYGSSFNQESYAYQQQNWVGGGWLRSDRKQGFLYEGPVCAVDGAVAMNRSVSFKFNKQDDSHPLHYTTPAVRRNPPTVTIGRTSTRSGSNCGVVAKVLGGFHNMNSADDNPTSVPVILPVFSRGLLIPSTMPKSVTMLTEGDESLKVFLKWLATHPDIEHSTPPAGTEKYLILLRRLMDPEFIRKMWNPDYAGPDHWSMEQLLTNDYWYPAYSNGAGWLQRIYVASSAACPEKIIYTGKINKDGTPETKTEPAVPDNEVTELPRTYVDDKGITRTYYKDYSDVTRVYYGTQKTGYHYLLKRNGKLQTNEDISCDGQLYCGCCCGGICHGKESGPSRL